jgi:hypothetical protein
MSTDVQGSELRNFNDRVIAAQTQAQELSNHLEDLRTHCSEVRKHARRHLF